MITKQSAQKDKKIVAPSPNHPPNHLPNHHTTVATTTTTPNHPTTATINKNIEVAVRMRPILH